MFPLVSLMITGALAAGPVVAPGINSSRVVPGDKVSSEEVAKKLSSVKVIVIGQIDGPHGGLFERSAVASLNNEKQGRYRTAADLGASAVGGLGQAAAAATGIVAAGSGVVGAGIVAKKAEGAVEGGSEKAAARLDGVDRHPAEGFGILPDEGPTTADRIRAGAEKVADRQGALDGAAKLASAVGAAQVETALGLGKDAAKVTAALFRAGVEGNSPRFVGVHLPIEAKTDGQGDASLTAKVNLKKLPDEEYIKKEKKKKRDKNGKVVKDKDGNVVWIVVQIPCTKRTVEVGIKSRLSLPDGDVIAKTSYKATEVDDVCGKKRMQKIKSPEEMASHHVSAAGRVWGKLIQPQMDTMRLKFFPTGATALGIDHILQNRHAAGMCLLKDAQSHDEADAAAHYNQAIAYEAWGIYSDALTHFDVAEKDPAFSKGRWNNGAARIRSRNTELALMKTAYGMVPQPLAFPHAETCPSVDRTDAKPVTKRVDLKDGAGGDDIRRLYEGELLKVLRTEGKWSEVEQLDGSVGWVKTKRAFK